MKEARSRKQRIIPEMDCPGLEELNLVEFPLVLLARQIPASTKTVEFQDEIFDRDSGEHLRRSVVVTSADKWGLPNAQDMDVLLALKQLTFQKNRFRDEVVEFSLYELRRLLEWPNSGPYKQRLKGSLLKWLGVTVAYEHAWRAKNRWKSLHAFHLIERVSLTNIQGPFFDAEEPQTIKWSDVVVESIQGSHTKGLNWDFYINLKLPTAKRLYRFLDKRFGLDSSWSFELVPFCTEKLGMTRSYEPRTYKRKLEPAVDELEAAGFLSRVSREERFKQVSRGLYRVNFRQARKRRSVVRAPAERKSPEGLEDELLARGVKNAAALIESHSAEKIREQIENFDDRNTHGEELSAGWLRIAIEDEKGFGFRKGFKSTAQRKAEAERKRQARIRQEQEKLARKQALEEEQRRDREGFRAFERARNLFPSDKQQQLEADAMNAVAGNSVLLRGFRNEQARGEVGLYHRMLWEGYILPNFADEVEAVWALPEADDDAGE